MRRLLTLTALALAALPAAPAAAADPDGLHCGFSTMTDWTTGQSYAEFDAGPIVLDPDPAGQPVWGSVTCTLVDGRSHDSRVIGTASSETTPVVAALEPTLVPVEWADDDVLSICVSVEIVGRGRLYYDPEMAGGDGGWTTDPAASCDLVFGPAEPLPLVDDAEELVDSIVCPLLAVAFPPQGDVPGIWDCPPYGS